MFCHETSNKSEGDYDAADGQGDKGVGASKMQINKKAQSQSICAFLRYLKNIISKANFDKKLSKFILQELFYNKDFIKKLSIICNCSGLNFGYIELKFSKIVEALFLLVNKNELALKSSIYCELDSKNGQGIIKQKKPNHMVIKDFEESVYERLQLESTIFQTINLVLNSHKEKLKNSQSQPLNICDIAAIKHIASNMLNTFKRVKKIMGSFFEHEECGYHYFEKIFGYKVNYTENEYKIHQKKDEAQYRILTRLFIKNHVPLSSIYVFIEYLIRISWEPPKNNA